jgi:hypothetical protein
MLYGKYKGEHLSAVPQGYLEWVLGSQKKATPFTAAVRSELARRKEAPNAQR